MHNSHNINPTIGLMTIPYIKQWEFGSQHIIFLSPAAWSIERSDHWRNHAPCCGKHCNEGPTFARPGWFSGCKGGRIAKGEVLFMCLPWNSYRIHHGISRRFLFVISFAQTYIDIYTRQWCLVKTLWKKMSTSKCVQDTFYILLVAT